MNVRPLRFLPVMLAAAFAALICAPAQASPLILGVQVKKHAVVVYELPQAKQRKETVAYIKSLRDRNRNYKDTEFIDAPQISEVLKDKLKDGFVLYTTLDERSSLLQKAIAPLGIKVQKHRIVCHGREHVGDDLSLYFVGANPFGDGKIVVYAASTNELLRRHFPAGPHSYHLYGGDVLLEEGDYDEDFRPLIDKLPVADALNDAKELFKNLEDVHPDLFARIAQPDYERLKQDSLRDISATADGSGQVRVNDLAYVLYRVAAFCKDGHTHILAGATFAQEDLHSAAYPPFVLEFRNGKYYVLAAQDRTLSGLEIEAINDTPLERFLDPIISRCSGDTPFHQAYHFVMAQKFWWTFSRLFAGLDQFTLRVKDVGAREREVKVRSVDVSAFDALREKAPIGGPGGSIRVEFLAGGTIAHAVFPAISDKAAIERIFGEIKDKGASELILDLRKTPGGWGPAIELLMSYLTEKPFRENSQELHKISAQWVDYCRNRGGCGLPSSESTAALDGKVRTLTFSEERHHKPAAFFPGRAVLLIDHGSFSGASQFATMFRDYGLGEIIGYETGGRPTSFADGVSMRLAHSGIEYQVASLEDFSPFAKPGDDQHGVLPTVPVTEEILRKYEDKEDPVLAFTVDRIIKSRAKE